MPCIEKEPIYQYERYLNILFFDVSVAQFVASMSGVVLGGVAEVVGSNLARGKYLQHLSAQLIHYIPPYLSTV